MRTLRNLLLTATALVPIGALPAIAGPNGATVVGGSANVQNPGTANVTVNQFSDKAIINWNLFNIGVGEKTTFVQPNSGSIALNRVVGGLGPSEILGTLNANGRVFVVNRDGIIFGAGAVVTTAGFLATTSDIKNEDFMAGRFNFQIPGKPEASIVNMGTITASSGGFAALVAPGVRNSGTITANLGTVVLGAGNIFNLDFYGDKLITLGVGDQIASQVKDVATGQTLKSLVTNEGKLKANGGRVELTAAAARQVVDSVINTSGVIEANSIGMHNGQIVLSAATAATKGDAPPQKVLLSGTLSAAGKRAGTKGGSIIVTGETIEVKGATIDASGRDGGGKVLIGGDWGGGKPDTSLVANQSAKLESGAIPTATTVSVDAATRIDASAKDRGDGGKVVLWSDQVTSFAGTILALGGTQFGNGGFVETSSHGQLNVSGTVNAGRGGTWLLDPSDITVDTALASSIQTSLNNGTSVTENTGTGPGGNGDIIFNSGVRIAWNTSATLTLIAFRNITFNDGAFGTPPGNIANTGAGNLVMRADSTGTGTGTLNLIPFTNSTRINWTNSTGHIELYYNPQTFGTQNNFTTGNGNIAVASASQLQQYMLVNTTAQLGSIGASPASLGEKYAIGPASLNAGAFGGFPSGTTFNGVLTGNGGVGTNSTISGLTTRLFPIIGSGGTVRDLNLTGVNIAATGNTQQLSSLAGENDGTITNVTAAGTITANTSFNGINAGGLVAQNASTGTITNSQSSVAITIGSGITGPSGFNYAGGLAGQNAGTIGTSSASGNVTGGINSFVGGLVGQNGTGFGGTITASAASGNVTGGSAVGGLAGFNSNGASIASGGSTGGISGTGAGAMVGGLVGQNEGSIANSAHTTGAISGNGSIVTPMILGGLVGSNNAAGTVQNSSVTGTSISGTNAVAGGLVGTNSGHITGTTPGAVFANTTITLDGASSMGGGLSGTNSTSGVIHNASAAGTLNRPVGASSSVLMGGLVGGNAGSIDNSTASTTVNVGVGTGGGLVGQNDGSISASSASGNVSGTGVLFSPALLGGLVGDNHATGTITGSSATGTVSTGGFANIGGLIGSNSGNLSNLSAANPITTSGNQITAGGLIGTNTGNLSNMFASNAVSASGNQVTIGGLVGFNNGGTITNSRATGNVTSTFNATGMFDLTAAGGLVGSNSGTINGTSQPNAGTACGAGASCATGNVSVGSHGMGGGLVGFNSGNNITNSFATGTVTGGPGLSQDAGTNLGGLVGLSSGGAISGSHARGAVGGNVAFLAAGGLVGDNGSTINNSFATGNVTAGNQSHAGGLVGSNGSDCTGCTGNISNSSASGNVTVGAASFAGGFAGSTGNTETFSNISASGAVTGGANSVLGGLIGAFAPGATITGSHATGAVSSTGANVMAGGLIGAGFGTISNSTASGPVSVGSDSYAGGLIGGNLGRVENSTTTATVSGGSTSVIGGLAGMNAGTVTQSSASGAVTTGDFGAAGGLVGANVMFIGVPPGLTIPGSSFPNGTIVSSSSTGAVTGGSGAKVGGLIGLNGGAISGLSSSATVSGGAGSTVGGLVGMNGGLSGGPNFPSALTGTCNCGFDSVSVSSTGGSIANSSASGHVSGGSASIVGGLVGDNAGTISNSQSSVALNLPAAAAVGGLVGSNDAGASIVNSSASGNVSGAGTIGGLVGISGGSITGSSASGNVTGGPGTTMGGLVGANGGTIGNSTSSGVVAGGPGGIFGGLVGANSGTITNSSETGAVVVDPGIGGGLVGYNIGTITGSHASGAVTGDDGSFVGGLVGFNIVGTIQNSYSVSNVTTGAGGGAGGLVAINMGNISQSFATGKVTGGDNSYVGGLVAFNFGNISALGSAGASSGPTPPVGAISQSYATGAVSGGANSVAGGLVGENAGSIDQAYAAGRVTGGAGSITGGLVASNNFTVPGGNPLFPTGLSGTPGTATNSYWDTQTTGQSSSAGGTGATSAQLTNTVPSGFSNTAWTTAANKYPFFPGQPDPLPVPGDAVTVIPTLTPTPTPTPTPQPQPTPTPDNNLNIPALAPQNIVATLVNDLGLDKKPDLVITNQSGPSGGGAGQGGGSPGGQKGGAQPGGARPPANVVAAYGLGALPSGMPPLNETRFRNDEAVFQLGANLSQDDIILFTRQLGLQILYQEKVELLGRTVLRLKLPEGATVRGVIAEFEKKGANFSGQPSYQYEMVQDVAQAPSPADTNRKGDSAQYIVEKLGLPEAHLVATGKDVKVAVIDSEIDANHPDLQGAVTGSYDALPSDDQSAHPHGTGMAGAIASHKRLLGIAPNARLLAVRAFGVNTGGAQGTSLNIVKGLQWAVDQGAKIINMSFAGPRDPILQQAIKRLTDQGIILIAAAGNAGPKSPPLFPGADPNVIAVSATDVDDKTYKGANRGKYIAIAAPGVDILVPAPDGGYQLTTGTSVAAAHISGVVALMLERNKELKPAEVRNILSATAKNIGGVKTDVGAGLVDPVQALAKSGPKSAQLQ